AASSPAAAARSRYARTVERASFAPADMALKFGPNSARNRNTSLIRRISALGLGTTATPPKRPDSSRDYFDVSGGSLHPRGGEFTGLRWRFRPASGGDY